MQQVGDGSIPRIALFNLDAMKDKTGNRGPGFGRLEQVGGE